MNEAIYIYIFIYIHCLLCRLISVIAVQYKWRILDPVRIKGKLKPKQLLEYIMSSLQNKISLKPRYITSYKMYFTIYVIESTGMMQRIF